MCTSTSILRQLAYPGIARPNHVHAWGSIERKKFCAFFTPGKICAFFVLACTLPRSIMMPTASHACMIDQFILTY